MDGTRKRGLVRGAFVCVMVLGPAPWGASQEGAPVVQQDSRDPSKVLADYIKMKDDKSEAVRMQAVRNLFAFKDDRRVQDQIVSAIKEVRGDAIKLEAANLIASLSIPRERLYSLKLSKALGESERNPALQVAICNALAVVGDGAAAPQVSALFRKPEIKVAYAAVRAAGKINDLKFFDPLLGLMREMEKEDPPAPGRHAMREAVKTALNSLSGLNAGDVAEWAAWYKHQQQDTVKKALEEFSQSIKTAKDDNERASAIFMLGETGLRDRRIVDRVRPYLTIGNDTLRGVAIDVIAAHRNIKDVSQILMNALEPNRGSPRIVEKLLGTFGRLYPEPWMEGVLLQYLRKKEDDLTIVSNCARSMGGVGGAKSLDALLGLFESVEKDSEKIPKAPRDEKGRLEHRVKTLEPALKEGLARLTGQRLEKSLDYHKWWLENRAKYKFPADLRRAQKDPEVVERPRPVEGLRPKGPPQPHVGDGTGLAGQYYTGRDFTDYKVARVDDGVDFDWWDEGPDPAVGRSNFCARWTGQVLVQFSETYTFYCQATDGARLWVNGKPIVDEWRERGIEERSGTIALTAGQKVDIKMDYYVKSNSPFARLLWSSPSLPKCAVPKSQLFPAKVESPPPTAIAVKPTPAATEPGVEKPAPTAVTPASSSGVPNLLVNGGFDEGSLVGWAHQGGTVNPIGQPHQGMYAIQLLGGNGVSLSQSLAGKCEAGKTYTVTAWIKIVSAGGSSGVPRLRVSRKTDLAEADFGEAIAQYATLNEWQKLQLTCTFSDEDLKQGVFIGVRHFGFNGTDHVDDIAVAVQ